MNRSAEAGPVAGKVEATVYLILGGPSTIRSPFFLLTPGWARLPVVFLAAAATVIAWQAVITGAFSVTHQAARIGCLPWLRAAFISEEMTPLVYKPDTESPLDDDKLQIAAACWQDLGRGPEGLKPLRMVRTPVQAAFRTAAGGGSWHTGMPNEHLPRYGPLKPRLRSCSAVCRSLMQSGPAG